MKKVFSFLLLILIFTKCTNDGSNKEKNSFIPTKTKDSSIDKFKQSSIIRIITYNEDSLLESEIMFDTVLKKKEGEVKLYHKNGKLKQHGMWHKDKQEGVWTFYNDRGNITSEISFKNNKQDGASIFYNTKRVIIEKTNWRNGYLHGTSLEYYDNGKLKRLTKWMNGKKINEDNYAQ